MLLAGAIVDSHQDAKRDTASGWFNEVLGIIVVDSAHRMMKVLGQLGDVFVAVVCHACDVLADVLDVALDIFVDEQPTTKLSLVYCDGSEDSKLVTEVHECSTGQSNSNVPGLDTFREIIDHF